MVLEGKSVFGGIAIGRLSIYNKKENQVKRSFYRCKGNCKRAVKRLL